jgi:hypothetical protein
MVETDFYALLAAPTQEIGWGGFGEGETGGDIIPSPVAAIVGNRIHPNALPPDAEMPAIHYRIVGGASKSTQDTTGSQRYRVEVNCWSDGSSGGNGSYLQAATLRAAVISQLNRRSGGSIQLIDYIQPIDDFDHELLQHKCVAEFYLYANL